MARGGLNPRQQRFVLEYLIDMNATQAAIRAGYAVRTARQVGSRLLTNVDIAAAIADELAAQKKRCQASADDVLLEETRIALADVRRLVEWGVDATGNDFVHLVPSDALPASVAACVKSVEMTRNGVKITMHDKMRALEMLGRHHGLDRSTLDDGSNLRERLVALYEAAGRAARPEEVRVDDADVIDVEESKALPDRPTDLAERYAAAGK